VYKNTLATLRSHIQQTENPTTAAVISPDAAHADNTILLDYLTSSVALQEPEIGCTELNNLTHNNCPHEQLHFGKPGGCEDYNDEGDEIEMCEAHPTASWSQRAATELQSNDLGTSDVDEYEDDDGHVAEVDEKQDASQADAELTQTLEDSVYSTRECEDWTVYFRPVKEDNGEVNATASDVCDGKTVL
jgi:hypothetical protein